MTPVSREVPVSGYMVRALSSRGSLSQDPSGLSKGWMWATKLLSMDVMETPQTLASLTSNQDGGLTSKLEQAGKYPQKNSAGPEISLC